MLDTKVRYFKLVFFQGTKSDDFIFPFNGGLKDAIVRGRKHCDDMGWRFGTVRPAIVDLDHQRELKSGNSDFDHRVE